MATRTVWVIGAGPAGCAAAVEAARAGCAVTLVTQDPVGGRATHASLVPSKVLLHIVAERRARGALGRPDAADVAHLLAEIDRTARAQAERMQMRLADAGVRVLRGRARMVAPDALDLSREGRPASTERFDAVVIATGSVPVFPAGFFGDAEGPDGRTIVAPRHLRTLSDLPRSMLVVGGGATGAEAVHAFLSLGVEVTWIVGELGILPEFDRELADSLGDVLMERGTKIVTGKRVLRVVREGAGVTATLEGGRSYDAERAFVAVGRRADTGALGLEAIGVPVDPRTGAVPVDERMRTAVPSVLAAGDATGKPFVANKAAVQGWIAGRVAAGLEAPRAGAWVQAVYTEPEVAMCGLSPQRAAHAGRRIDVRTVRFDEALQGLLHGVADDRHARGVLRLVLDADSRALIGASAIGPHAAEVLGPIAVAIDAGVRVDTLAACGMASPTFGEIAAIAAR